MTKVAEGNLDVRVPVTSNDEVGELTGQFNTMVEGLREREKIRETFGRYVDESVAATILRRQGEGARSGATNAAGGQGRELSLVRRSVRRSPHPHETRKSRFGVTAVWSSRRRMGRRRPISAGALIRLRASNRFRGGWLCHS